MDAVRLGALLSSRLCHDVIGPASAVVNGLELVETEGGVDVEAMAMIASSAAQISNRLQFYRAAYGVAAGLGMEEARRVAVLFLEGGRITLDWPDSATPRDAGPGAAKLALNLVLLGVDLLGRGGRLVVGATRASLAVAALGEATRTEELAFARADEAAQRDITPRTVQPFYVACLAASMGARLQVAPAAGQINLSVSF